MFGLRRMRKLFFSPGDSNEDFANNGARMVTLLVADYLGFLTK
jgi:hypothetical protein